MVRKTLAPEMLENNVADSHEGASNLRKQIEYMQIHGVTPLVAINAFETDNPDDIEAVKRIAVKAGALGAAVSRFWAEGGKGAIELAELVVDAANQPNDFEFLYELEQPINGAGFIYPICVRTMPAPPEHPSAERRYR